VALSKASLHPETAKRWEVADIFREFGESYGKENPLPLEQLKVMHEIEVCRTSYLGGHLEKCNSCGHERPAYNAHFAGVSIISEE
jgi:hypothetical protein